MKIKKTWVAVCIAIAAVGFCGIISKGYTQEIVNDSGINYPVSLATGQDKSGRKIFNDENFLKYIGKEVFVSGRYSGNTFDLDEDGYLSKEECETVRVLSVAGRTDITNVSGIEAFPKLREFYCNNSGLKELDLSHNPRVQILVCSHAPIATLNIRSCTILKELKVSGCALAHMDLAPNSAIELLACSSQYRDVGGYQEDGKYLVNLTDLDPEIDVSRISDVLIDGAEGDGIHSGYNPSTGVVYCSDEIQTVSYTYHFAIAGSPGESMDSEMNITLTVANGYRESFQTDGGSTITARYYDGTEDSAPEEPVRDGYTFTGWYSDRDRRQPYSFHQILDRNLELYAGWEKKFYRVIYRAEGTGLNGKARDAKTDWWSAGLIPEGKEIPTRPGYELSGWKTETGRLITSANADDIQYKDAASDSGRDYTVLEAVWRAKEYKLTLSVALPDDLRKEVENMPSPNKRTGYAWDSRNIPSGIPKPSLCGYSFGGWYTAATGGLPVTAQTTYGDIHRSQFSDDDPGHIPVLYARFTKRVYTIYYDERGGSKVPDRQNVIWGSSNLLPEKKTKRRGYIFAGWKYHDKKVTAKTKLNNFVDGYSDSITVTAAWRKISDEKGKIFKRYGCVYRIKKSGRKKKQVILIRITKKKVTLRNKIFLNGKFYKLKGIKKKALKKAKRVRVKTGRKLSGRYVKMARKAGAKKRVIKKVYVGKGKKGKK